MGQRLTIAVGFAGGANFGGTAVLERGVKHAADMEPWLKAMGELQMIADLKPCFIAGDQSRPGIAEWQQLARMIKENYQATDGMVIIHEPGMAAVTATALNAMVRRTGKPIVLSPGREAGAPAGRSNLINALQTAVMDLAGTFVIAGSQLLAAGTVSRAANGTLSGQPVAKIDFGIRLFKHRRRQPTLVLKLAPEFAPEVPAVVLTPGATAPSYLAGHRPAGLVLISGSDAPLDARMMAHLVKHWAKIAVVVVGQVNERDAVPPAWIHDPAADPNIATVRLMWARAQAGDWRKHYRMLMDGGSD
jgi:L-asparaginase/Glu-tRNA(Gln) amidotransferase subunit D